MAWFVFAFLAALFDALYYASIKRFVKNVDLHVLSTGIFLITALLLFAVSWVKGFPEVHPGFLFSVLATGILNVIAVILQFKALKTTDISLAVPMLSFTPLFLILTSFFILGEVPTFIGILGILLVVIGAYFMNKGKTLFAPFKALLKNKGTLFMLIVALSYSISINFDKRVVQESDPFFGSALIFFFIGLCFLIISLAQRKSSWPETVKASPAMLLTAGALAAAVITVNIAYTQGIVSYVIAVKRLSILFSVFFGGIFFSEKDFVRRIIAALLMLAGVVLIIVL